MADPQCKHSVTQGRKGQKGSWCINCSTKILEVHGRPCGECKHFEPWDATNITGLCRPHFMTVTSSMHVTYYINPNRTGQHGLCFEPKSATS